MRLNFGKGEHGRPHLYYCSVAEWILQFHSDPLFALAAKWFIIITIFATITFVLASSTDVLYSIGEKNSNKTETVPWLTDKIKVGEGWKIKNCRKNGNYYWLSDYLMEVKNHRGTVKVRIPGGAILRPNVGQIYTKKKNLKRRGGGGRGGGGGSEMWYPTYARFFFFFFSSMHLKEWTLLKWLKLKKLREQFFKVFFNVLNNCKCEDSNDGAFGVILLLF